MCGVCSYSTSNDQKAIHVISQKNNVLLLVLLFVSCASIGLSCFAVYKVQNVRNDLDDLRKILSTSEFRIIEERPNNAGDNENEYHPDFYISKGNAPRRSTDRVKRNLNAEDHTETDRTTEDHQIKRKSIDFEPDIETETFKPDEYQARHDFHRHRHRGKNNQLEIIDEFSPQAGRLKSLIATHFEGDTSKYVYGHHTNFNGNGHLRHPKKTFVDWKESSWASDLDSGSHFTINEGVVTIKEAGLYFVYAQIYYLDEHDMNGYRVYKNSDIFLQCTTTSHSSERVMKGNTCYTAGVSYLEVNDAISLRDIMDGRYSLFEPGKSFFGIIKLGAAEKR